MKPNLIRLAALALFAACAPAQALSLRAAATAALHHDPRFDQSEAEIDAARAGESVARAGSGLSLGFAADVGRSDFETDALFPASGVRTPSSFSLAASQPLYTGGRTSALEDAARRAVEAALEKRRDVGGKLILATLTAYLDLKRDRETAHLSTVNRETLTQARSDVDKRYQAGEATRTDLALADARLAEAAANVERSQAQLRASEIALTRLLGTLPADLDAPWPEFIATAASREEAISQSHTAPAVLSAQHSGRAAQSQIRAAAAERLPKLSLDARAGTQDDSDFGYERLSTWAVQLKLQVPILTGGLVNARVREASAKASSAQYAAADTEAYYAETAAREWELLRASGPVIAAYQSQVRAAELALDGVNKELKVGSRTTLDLLDAERDLLSAQVNLVGAQRDRAVTAFRLLAACGKLELENVPD